LTLLEILICEFKNADQSMILKDNCLYKKVLFFLLIFFSINTVVFACNNTKKYYTYLHKAEEAIIDDDFDVASKNYIKAFTFLEYPFPNDLLVASICMLKSKDYDIQLLKKWNHLYSFQKNNTIEEKIQEMDLYIGTSYHSLLAQNLWEVISKNSENTASIDSTVRKICKEIHQKDQGIRHEMDEQFGVEKYWIPEARKQIIKVDSLNLVLIDSIISLENFSEYIVGDYGIGIIFLSFLHNAAWQKQEVYNVSEKIKSLVKNGKIDNRRFAYTFDRFCDFISADKDSTLHCVRGYYYAEGMYWVYDEYRTYINYNVSEADIINKRREKLFLSPLHLWVKQLNYQIKKENLFFIRSKEWGDLTEEFLLEKKILIEKGELGIIK